MLLWTEIAIYGRRSAHAPWLAVYRQALVNQRCASPSIAILRGSAEYRCSAYGRFQMPPGVEVFTDHDDEYLE